MESSGVLLYCVAGRDAGCLSVIPSIDEECNLYKVEYRDINGIVSDVSFEEYGEENLKIHGEDVGWLTGKAEKFMNTISAINYKTTIIPMKFLTIFNSTGRVLETLKDKYEDFEKKLKELRNKREWSVKIYCDHKTYKSNCMEEEIEEFEKSLKGKPKGMSYLLRKKFESLMDDMVQEKILNTANSIAGEIEKGCFRMVSNKLLSRELTGRKEQMLLNCALLVCCEDEDSIVKQVDKIRERYKKQGFIIDCTGPWPPYSFC